MSPSASDALVLDLRGLTDRQRAQVRLVMQALLRGLFEPGEVMRLLRVATALEICQEAERRLRTVQS